jgi:predicted nucleic-acid-binding protein
MPHSGFVQVGFSSAKGDFRQPVPSCLSRPYAGINSRLPLPALAVVAFKERSVLFVAFGAITLTRASRLSLPANRISFVMLMREIFPWSRLLTSGWCAFNGSRGGRFRGIQAMKGLDISILIRYLTQDDPVQSLRANEIIDRDLSPEAPGFVSLLAIAEVASVLRSRYKATRQEIVTAIERILSSDSFQVQNEQQVCEAMIALRTGEGTFADALICALGAWAGCSSTLTFDGSSQLPHFEVV